jgi:hypothetical protein
LPVFGESVEGAWVSGGGERALVTALKELRVTIRHLRVGISVSSEVTQI